MYTSTDDQIAEAALKLFQTHLCAARDGLDFKTILMYCCKQLHLKWLAYGRLKQIIRGRPTVFGIYNYRKKQRVMCLIAGNVSNAAAHFQPCQQCIASAGCLQ
jgi:phosphotransacetylase